MLLLSLLAAPAVMLVALEAERRCGSVAGGWVAALPVSLPVGLVAVAAAGGTGLAGRLAWSAAGHVAAQVLFAGVLGRVMRRRGFPRGFAGGLGTYAMASVVLAGVPEVVAVAAAAPALAFVPRLLPTGRARPAARPGAGATVATCLGTSAVVAVTVLGSRGAGPEIGGALAAFPTVTALFTLLVTRRAGDAAGADVLAGLVRSLPCYLTFCVVAAAAMPAAGLLAVPLALGACLLAGRLTWRTLGLPSATPVAQ